MAPVIDRLLTKPATLLKRVEAERDTYGDPTYTVERTLTRCELQQAGSHEDHEQAVQVSTWRLFLPASTELRGWDAVECERGIYELNGDPWPVTPPRSGVVHHVEALVVRTSFSSSTTYDELDDEYETYGDLTATRLDYNELSGQDEWVGAQ